jgi:hypothetical protein
MRIEIIRKGSFYYGTLYGEDGDRISGTGRENSPGCAVRRLMLGIQKEFGDPSEYPLIVDIANW